MDLANRLRVKPSALIGKIVAADAGDCGIAQTHRPHRLCDPHRLAGVEAGRLAGVDLAEVAASGAYLAADQEGCFAVLPALENVRATRLLADRVQALTLDQFMQFAILRPYPRRRLDPRRLLLNRSAGVANLQAQRLAAFGGDGHLVSLLCSIARSVFDCSLRSLRIALGSRCLPYSLADGEALSALSLVQAATRNPGRADRALASAYFVVTRGTKERVPSLLSARRRAIRG